MRRGLQLVCFTPSLINRSEQVLLVFLLQKNDIIYLYPKGNKRAFARTKLLAAVSFQSFSKNH